MEIDRELANGPLIVDWDEKLSTKERVLDLIIKVSREEDINPVFVMAIVKAESNFDHLAVSRMGAIGLMQVMPKTAWWLDSGLDVYNPEDNLRLGIRYFKLMRTKFKGYTQLALAAYNAGPGNVMKAGWKIPNITETQVYVPRVMAYYNKYREVAVV
jgi:soluble lytic murein transglycosylase-like protein